MKIIRSLLAAGGLALVFLCGLYSQEAGPGPSKAKTGPPDPEIYKFLERFHGHTCPGSLMGLRLGMAAKDALKGRGKLRAKCFVLDWFRTAPDSEVVTIRALEQR